MEQEKINEAVNEARRFIEKANAYNFADNNKRASYSSIPKESGALRRASLDLTRALAKLRGAP